MKIQGEPGRKSPARLPSSTQIPWAALWIVGRKLREPFDGIAAGDRCGAAGARRGARSAAGSGAVPLEAKRNCMSAMFTGEARVGRHGGTLAGDFRRGFPRIRPKSTPGTPLDRRGPPSTSISTRNQAGKPTLTVVRGIRKTQPNCRQVPNRLTDAGLPSTACR